MQIGVLDIQGSVKEHAEALARAGAQVVLVKKFEDLRRVNGLIIPGGESTTIGKLLERFGLGEEIIKRATGQESKSILGAADLEEENIVPSAKPMPVWGTCAGAILIAKKIIGKQSADKLNLMDITVERNAYGRQLESQETEIEFLTGDGDKKVSTKIPAIFIRAPRIAEIGPNVEVLATYEGDIVAARQENFLATTFHPEMTTNTTVHRYFMDMCKESL